MKTKDCDIKNKHDPGELTKYLESLDVSIDNPLKDELRRNTLKIVLNKNKAAHEYLKKI